MKFFFFFFSLGWRVFRDHFGLELCMMKPLMYCWKTPEVAGLLESWLLRTLLKKLVFPCVYTVGTVLTSVWQNPLSDKDIFSYFPFAKCSLNARWTKVIFIFRENVFFCNKSVCCHWFWGSHRGTISWFTQYYKNVRGDPYCIRIFVLIVHKYIKDGVFSFFCILFLIIILL